MPLNQTTTVTAAGDVITLDHAIDLTIAPGVFVGSENGMGVRGLGGSHDVQVYGVVSGEYGVYLGAYAAGVSNNAVHVFDNAAVYGTSSGVLMQSTSNRVINDGIISSDSVAVEFSAYDIGSGISYVTNRGIISGLYGVYAPGGDAVQVSNAGTIEGYEGGYAVYGSGQNDIVKNAGTITGDVLMGDGKDLYDGRNGTIDGAIHGGGGQDKLYAGTGDDEIHGDAGNDTLIGGAGRDVLNGGTGTDRASYTSADAAVTVNLSKPSQSTGDAKGDTYVSIEEVFGSHFNDKLTGNSSNNALLGGDGNDTLNGGTGKDILSGGNDNDTFVFTTALNASTNVDTITDFNVADDRIQIDNAVFLGLSNGTLASGAFRSNASGNAADASDRIIFETDTGRLYFDADGNGAGAKIHFATVTAGLALTNADFIVI